jgi:hypothetical protein
MMSNDDAGGIKGTSMKTCDGRMFDKSCTRKGFLENRQIQRRTTHVFEWMIILLYKLQPCLCFHVQCLCLHVQENE